jgi:phosphatidylglycerol---prolipoprotein diacylglyceryl transferase
MTDDIQKNMSVIFFLYRWESYRDQPLDMFKIWEGGCSSYGVFFGASIVAIYYARQHRINFWPLADAGIYAFMCG